MDETTLIIIVIGLIVAGSFYFDWRIGKDYERLSEQLNEIKGWVGFDKETLEFKKYTEAVKERDSK